MITLERVSFAYDRDTVIPVPAVREVSLRIEPGACLGIVGASGSGKTTLLQLMAGLLRPTAGRVMLDGRDLTQSPDLRRKICFRVGLAFQFPERQLFEGTVFEDVAYGPRNMGLGEADVEERVHESLARVGFEPGRLADRSPLALSHGEMRRVALAGILAMKPQILLLDEPTAGLDEDGRRRLAALLRSLQGQGVGVVAASHDVGFLSELARALLLLDGGRVVGRGSVRTVLADPRRLRDIGVAAPFSSEVLAGLAESGRPVDVRSLTMAGVADALVTTLGGKRGRS